MSYWHDGAFDKAEAVRLAAELDVPVPLAAVLAARVGTDPETVDLFLHPRLSLVSDPMKLPGMSKAVERIQRALQANERIVVFGDYDVDGITSTALMVKVLRELGGDVCYYLPDRIDEGYGLSVEALASCLDRHNPSLIVTVDCGTGSSEAVSKAAERGVDVVVTDHHHVGGTLAPASALVNPRLSDDETMHILAGVGVAFKLCHALVKQTHLENSSAEDRLDLRDFLGLVAVGTVADMVPLREENRTMVRHGLQLLRRPENPGIRALKKVAGVHGDVTAYHVGFLLGPRLNAAGRLGTAEDALELLLTGDPDRAADLAEKLDGFNTERRKIEADTSEAAFQQLENLYGSDIPYTLVAAGAGWHPGVVGIVASRVSNRFHRPAIVLGLTEEGTYKGSCRSISGLHMVEALDRCADLLQKYGGHAMAAGVELSKDNLELFRQRFEDGVREMLKEEDLDRSVYIDAWLDIGEVNEPLITAMAALGPFGYGNATPVWGLKEVTVVGEPRILKEKHLKFRIAKGSCELDVLAWNMAHRDLPEGRLDLAFKAELNEFRGRTSVQLNLVDFRPGS